MGRIKTIHKTRPAMTRLLRNGLVVLVLITVTATASYMLFHRESARIPAEIRDELTFSPLVISLDNAKYKASSYKLATVDNDTQLLSFVVTFDDMNVTVSEYIQPTQFTEIAGYKDLFMTNIIKQDATVQTSNGTIYLGKQQKQADKQLGVMLERGLVIMLNPSSNITNAKWRVLGEQFEIQKISN